MGKMPCALLQNEPGLWLEFRAHVWPKKALRATTRRVSRRIYLNKAVRAELVLQKSQSTHATAV